VRRNSGESNAPHIRFFEREACLQQVISIHEELVHTQSSEFSRIFETYHGLIFRTAYRITGNAADAEDVLQTIFLRLLRQPPSVQSIGKEESYLRRAAINASLDLLRIRQGNRAVPLNEETAEAIRPVGGEPPEYELKDCLRRSFASLSPRSAEIFALRHFEDFSNQQIAEALNISQVLVAVTLHRTRRQLQKQIRSYMGATK
jgi:RNA polymerase sigma-70 factor (ECF subfamily)